MQYDEFVERVQERTELPYRGAVERVIQATLETLGERLYRTQQENLAAMLPDQLKEYIGQAEPEATRMDVSRFPLDNFYLRVAGRAEINRTAAAERAHAVMMVLREAVTPAKWEDVRSNLPEEYEALLT